MSRYNEWARRIVHRISKGQRTRKRQAVVALARKLLVRSEATDGSNQRYEPRPSSAS